MKSNLVLSFVVIASCLVSGCLKPGASSISSKPEHVVFVCFDGLAGWCVKEHPEAMPTLSKMMREGAWTLSSHSILPSSSALNWHSIYTCSASEQHGYVDWNSDKPVFPPPMLTERGFYPDIFAVCRAQRPSAKIDYFYEWTGLAFVIDTNACDVVMNAKEDEMCAAFVKDIRERKPTLANIGFNDPDHTGHGKGWGSPEYVATMTRLDSKLNAIMKAIEEAGIADETVVVVSSDHGGHDKRHGMPILKDMARPLVIWGKGVRKGYEIKSSTTVYDTGATMAALLGLEFPQAWIGRPVIEAFE